MQFGCQLHFLQKEKFKEVLLINPHIDKHYYLEQNGLRKSLKEEDYDLVIDLHKNLRSAKIKRWLSVKTITYYKANVEKFMLVNFKVDRMPEEHLVDRYFKSVKELGIVNDGEGLDFYMSEAESKKSIEGVYIALIIGAAHQTKQIPVKLCKEIIELSKVKIVLLGGRAEIERSRQLQASVGLENNLVGKLTLQESGRVVRNSAVVITGDTGLMHISAALQKPIVSVWGSTIAKFGMYPYYGNHDSKELRVEMESLSCRPCTKIGKDRCPIDHFKCMNDLSANDIILKTNELLLRN